MSMISLSSHHDLPGDYNSNQLNYIMIFQIVFIAQSNDNDNDYDDVFVTFQTIPVFG